MMAEQKFFFILLLSGLCCLAIAPLFLFQNSERNSVSFTPPRTDAYRHCVCPYRLLRFCGTGQLRGLI